MEIHRVVETTHAIGHARDFFPNLSAETLTERERARWNRKTDIYWITALHEAGVTPGQIDFVLCTHLHVDHVGWNTKLEDGRLVPTFPNARYLFSQNELEYWMARNAEQPVAT